MSLRVSCWLADVGAFTLPVESVSLIGYAEPYIALGSGGWWEEKTDPGVRGIDQFLAHPDQLGQGLGTRLLRALVELLFSDPAVTKI